MSEANDGQPSHLLALKGVSKSFGPVQALSEVDFEIEAGEVVALVGDNGAGKSTLVKAMDGVQPADSGEMYFEGRQVRVHDPKAAAQLGITTVYQDLALCDNLDVVANLFLGQEEVAGDGARPVHTWTRRTWSSGPLQLLDDLSVTTLGSVRTLVGSRAASASRWRSPAPWSATRRWSSSTSPPRRSASPRPSRSCAW